MTRGNPLNLKRDLILVVLGLGLLASTFYLGASWGLKRSVGRAQTAQAVSDTAHGQAVAHADAAAKSDSQASSQAITVAKADKAVKVAKERLQALPPVPNFPEIPDSSAAKDSVITQQEAVIVSQDQEIAALKLQVSIEHASALQWKQAYEDEARALEAQKVVSKSYQDAMKEAAW